MRSMGEGDGRLEGRLEGRLVCREPVAQASPRATGPPKQFKINSNWNPSKKGAGPACLVASIETAVAVTAKAALK